MPIIFVRDVYEEDSSTQEPITGLGQICEEDDDCPESLLCDSDKLCSQCEIGDPTQCNDNHTCIENESNSGAGICHPIVDFEILQLACYDLDSTLLTANFNLSPLPNGISNCTESVNSIISQCEAGCSRLMLANQLRDNLEVDFGDGVSAKNCSALGFRDLEAEYTRLHNIFVEYCACSDACQCEMPSA